MGWKGTMRSVVAASRRASRAAERDRKLRLKEQVAADAARAVRNWQGRLSDLVSFHKELAPRIDWDAIANTSLPVRPELDDKHERAAINEAETFKPGLFHRLFGGAEKRKARLVAAVKQARAKDADDYAKAKSQYHLAVDEYEADTAMAKKLVAGDEDAMASVIKEMETISEESLLGQTIRFNAEGGLLHAIPHLHDTSVVPNFRRKQLAIGKLSETKMPVGEFNELYQDYAASAAFRVAGDLFQILPIDQVYVTCLVDMLDTSTGHQKPSPILSVQFVRQTFERLNLTMIDPSDALSNFNHNMIFKRTKGFAVVEPLRSLPK